MAYTLDIKAKKRVEAAIAAYRKENPGFPRSKPIRRGATSSTLANPGHPVDCRCMLCNGPR